MDETTVIFNAELSGPAREEVLMGTTYTVLPAVLVKSQVLHNNLGACYLPPEAFTDDWAKVVNMAPVVIGPHPSQRGKPASAKDPAILNARGAGFLFHAKVEDDSLKADVFLDASRVDEVEGLDVVLEKVADGGVPEISTGFPAMAERKKGIAGNQAYDLVLYPDGYDHLAVFDDDSVGACSVEDGCGLGVHSRQDGAPSTEVNGMDKTGSRSKILAFLKSVVGFEDAENESDRDRNALLTAALTSAFAGIGQEIWIVDVFTDEGEVVFELWGAGADGGPFRTTFEISEEGEVTLGAPVEVRRITTYEPVTNADSNHSPTEGEVSAMKRQEVIAQLKGNGCPLSDERLEGLDDEELVAMNERLGKAAPAAEAATEVVDTAQAATTDAPDVMATLVALQGSIESLKTNVETQLATFGEAMAPAVAEIEAEKASLVAELAANEKAPFDEAELTPKPIEELRKLSAMSRGSDYTARAGITPVANTKAPAFMPTPNAYGDSSKGAEA